MNFDEFPAFHIQMTIGKMIVKKRFLWNQMINAKKPASSWKFSGSYYCLQRVFSVNFSPANRIR